MNRILIVAALAFSFPLAGLTQSTTQAANVTMPMSPREVHSLIKSAHSSEQYKQLAGYFHQREADDRAKAAAEKVELDRRAAVNAGLYQKYPRPVDAAKSIYDSYVSDADSAALQARHYDQLATAQPQHDRQLALAPQEKQ
jgi:hypothetical protein